MSAIVRPDPPPGRSTFAKTVVDVDGY